MANAEILQQIHDAAGKSLKAKVYRTPENIRELEETQRVIKVELGLRAINGSTSDNVELN